MRFRTFLWAVFVLAGISGNALCQTWTQCAHVGGIDTIQAIDIETILAPAPGVLLAATEQGIYRSTDAGSHWSLPLRSISSGIYLQGCSLSGLPDGRIFAGTVSGLSLSTDMGVSWTPVPGHPAVLTSRLARDSQGRLFTALWGTDRSSSGICRSTDNGVTWSKILDSVYSETLEMYPGDILFAGGYFALRRSTNAGQTWEKLIDSVGVRSIIVTTNGSILFGCYLFNPSLKMATYRSTDNGATWGEVAGFYSEYYATDANNFVYAASDSGMRMTTDNGTTWQVLNTGLSNRDGVVPWLRTLCRTGPNEFTAGEYHTGEIFRSTDLGAHWSTVSRVEAPQPTSANLLAIAYKKPEKLFLASALDGVEQWTEGGGLVYLNSGLTNTKVQTLHVAESGDLFAGTGGGIFRSTNDGAGWSKFGTPSVLVKAIVDLSNDAFLAGTNLGVLKYAVDGSSFTLMNSGLVSRNVNTLWSGTDGRTFVGTEDGLYRLDSTTWVRVNVSGGVLRVVDVDVFGQTLGVATRDSGVYVSTNNGQIWQHKTAGIEGLAIRAIVLTAQDKLYAATESNGVFATTTGSTQWTPAAGGMTDLRLRDLVVGPGNFLYAISDSGALLKTNASVVAVGGRQSLHPSTYMFEQNYPNPFNPSTMIRFGLPDRSHVTLTIFNPLGQIVRDLVNGEMEAGYHEVQFDASGLASGVYLYRITAETYTSTRKLVVLR